MSEWENTVSFGLALQNVISNHLIIMNRVYLFGIRVQDDAGGRTLL